MSQKKSQKKKIKPFNFKALSKRNQMKLIFSVETQILAELGKHRAMLDQILKNQERGKSGD